MKTGKATRERCIECGKTRGVMILYKDSRPRMYIHKKCLVYRLIQARPK
jgi:hypothetical protein